MDTVTGEVTAKGAEFVRKGRKALTAWPALCLLTLRPLRLNLAFEDMFLKIPVNELHLCARQVVEAVGDRERQGSLRR